jgi:NADH-quinone oxidoreductase subunit M
MDRGGLGSGDRLHGVGGGEMNTDSFNPVILTLVTFLPLAGGLLTMLLPRRDRDIRGFALVVSLLTFVASLHLPVHFHRGTAGFQFAFPCG